MTKFIEERPARLLSVGVDSKTVKGSKRGYLTGILYLFPYKSFGFNVCPNAENADCHEPCLNTAGRGRFNQVQAARLRKTWLFHNEREWFMERLFLDIEALQRKAQREGLLPAVRLNGTSDLDWESIRYQGESPMEHSSLTQFYDYTKLPRQVRNKNYHLTFSYSTDTKFQSSVKKAQRLGMNMAVVSDLPIPEAWMGRSVVNGDNDDLRFLDPDNCIVWLKVKGQALGSDSDLIVRAA